MLHSSIFPLYHWIFMLQCVKTCDVHWDQSESSIVSCATVLTNQRVVLCCSCYNVWRHVMFTETLSIFSMGDTKGHTESYWEVSAFITILLKFSFNIWFIKYKTVTMILGTSTVMLIIEMIFLIFNFSYFLLDSHAALMVGDVRYHHDCLRCWVCKVKLDGKMVTLDKENRPYCSKDYDK